MISFIPVVYLIIYDKKVYYKTTFYIYIGMYICLLVYMIIPNAQGLRVDLDTNHFFQRLLSIVYNNDTSTNVCPSIHTYNSIMMYIGLIQNTALQTLNNVENIVFNGLTFSAEKVLSKYGPKCENKTYTVK